MAEAGLVKLQEQRQRVSHRKIKSFFKTIGGNWANIVEVDYEKLNKGIGLATYLDQSVTKSNRPGMIRVNLPDKDVKQLILHLENSITTAQR